MKHSPLILAVAICAASVSDQGCDPAGRRTAVDVTFSVAETACIIAHAFTNTPPEILQVCSLAPEFQPLVEQLVSSERAAAAAAASKPGSGVCPPAPTK